MVKADPEVVLKTISAARSGDKAPTLDEASLTLRDAHVTMNRFKDRGWIGYAYELRRGETGSYGTLIYIPGVRVTAAFPQK